jgi:hypothetical protein
MVGFVSINLGDSMIDSFDARHSILETIKGQWIRAAINYLTFLSAKNISVNVLIQEKIISVDSEEAKLSEAIIIPNYRHRIGSALSLLRSWCREPTKSEFNIFDPPKLPTTGAGGTSFQ